jgi:predicted nucleic acid-binding protein
VSLFVDAGAHIALLDPGDQHHRAAAETWARLKGSPLATSIPVLWEVASRGATLVQAALPAAYLRAVLGSPVWRVVDLSRDLFAESLETLVKYEDQELSFTDASTVVILRRARIRRVFTFDRAFRRLGFEVLP